MMPVRALKEATRSKRRASSSERRYFADKLDLTALGEHLAPLLRNWRVHFIVSRVVVHVPVPTTKWFVVEDSSRWSRCART